MAALLIPFAFAASGVAADGPPLVDAARHGDRSTLVTLVQQGADVDEAEADGTTALLWASYRDDVDAAGLLVGAGARVDAANDLGATPIWAAGQNGSTAMTRLLLEAGADPNAALLLGETPVMVASRSGHPLVVGQLIAAGADVNARAARGQTALMWAASQAHPDVVQVLLAHGADVDARSDVWSQVMAVPPHGHPEYNRAVPHGSDTALMFAARAGSLRSARLLIDAGADVNDADAWGVSATAMAAHAGHGDLAGLLLDAGADPRTSAPGFTALHAAIMHRDEAMVRALVTHGADVNMPLESWTPTRRNSRDWNFAPELVGATPVWLAARFGSPAVLRILVDHGADPRFVHRGERVVAGITGDALQRRTSVTTAVMAALGMGGGSAWVPVDRSQREPLALEAVTLLADLGVDLNVADTNGRTALDAAHALGYETVVSLLVARGARAGTTNDRSPSR